MGTVIAGDRISRSSTIWHDQTDGSVLQEHKQDVSDILAVNKELFNDQDGIHFKGDMQRVASIPNVIYWQLWREGIVQDEKRLAKWLDDPSNSAFRTHPGKLSRTSR